VFVDVVVRLRGDAFCRLGGMTLCRLCRRGRAGFSRRCGRGEGGAGFESFVVGLLRCLPSDASVGSVGVVDF